MKRIAAGVLCVCLILSFAGCAKPLIDAPGHGLYEATLRTLIERNYNDLKSFVEEGIFAGTEGVTEIACTDHVLTRGEGALGKADLTSGDVFYEEGLVVYNTGKDFEPYRSDYVFVIRQLQGGRKYYFASYHDVEAWINQNCK